MLLNYIYEFLTYIVHMARANMTTLMKIDTRQIKSSILNASDRGIETHLQVVEFI